MIAEKGGGACAKRPFYGDNVSKNSESQFEGEATKNDLSLTELLTAATSGDSSAYDTVYGRSYTELRLIAKAYMRDVPLSDTLQPTALVNEAFARITVREDLNTTNSREFFGVLSRAMRDIIVEQARRHGSAKRGGAWSRVAIPLDELPYFEQSEMDIIRLDSALARLHKIDEASEEIVRLRFYCGLSLRAIAKLQGISLATVRQNWDYAKTWLYKELA